MLERETEILVYAPCYNHQETPCVLAVLSAIPKILKDRPPPPIEAAHWPTSVFRVSVYEDQLVVWWDDTIALKAFQWAFDTAWTKQGDERPVAHRLSEELTDDDLPF